MLLKTSRAIAVAIITLTFISIDAFAQPSAVSTGLTADVPDAYDAGINYIDNETVALVLHAPELSSVHATGDFNDWDEWLMNVSTDGDWWWIEIEGLTEGVEYAYQYLTDGVGLSGDPLADKVLDPWNDKWISDEIYPNLRDYPDGKPSGNGWVSVFETGQQAYTWHDDSFQRPDQTRLNVYELLVRDFSDEQSFKAVIERLDYLQLLGVNAIEVMPIQEFDGNNSWGYNPNFYFAVDKAYGTKNDFKRLVDEAHQRGMAVIMDVVYNFSWSAQSPYINMYRDWNTANAPLKEGSPMYNHEDPNTFYSWGYADINHESDFTKWFINKVNRYWVEEYHVDGYRYDFAKGFTNTTGEQGGYDATRIGILKGYADSIWAVDPGIYMILEYFVNGNEEKEMAKYSGPSGGNGFVPWINMHNAFSEGMLGWGGDPINHDWADPANRDWNGNGVVYFQSHDEERQMWRNYAYGNGSAKDTTVALERMAQMAAYFFTIPGSKMIFQFDELGYDYCINYSDYHGHSTCDDGSEDGRVDPKPVRWDYYEDERRIATHDVFGQIMRLRNKHTFMHTDDYDTDISTQDKIIVLRGDTNAVFMTNFAMNSHFMNTDITPIFPHTGQWYEYFSGDTLTINDQDTVLKLSRGEYKLWIDHKIDLPLVNECVSALDNELPGDTVLCDGSMLTLNANSDFESIVWNGVAAGSTFMVDEAGTYVFRGTDDQGCFSKKEVEVRYVNCDGDCGSAQDIDLGADTVICEKTTIELSVPEDHTDVSWNSEFGDHTAFVREAGEVYVSALDTNGCLVTGSIQIDEKDDCTDLLVNDEYTVRIHVEGMNAVLDCDLSTNDDLYVHMGVCTDNTTDCADPANLWKHVVGNWGQDDGIGKMTQNSADENEYTLTVDPDTYFTDPANAADPFQLGSTVYSISMVIRTADGSNKCPQNGDLFAFDMDTEPSTVKRIQGSSELELDSIVEINGEVGYSSVAEIVDNKGIAAYPNPASTATTIIGDWNPGQPVLVSVRNSIGQLVLSEVHLPINRQGAFELSLNQLDGQQGLYLVDMQQGAVKVSTRVVYK